MYACLDCNKITTGFDGDGCFQWVCKEKKRIPTRDELEREIDCDRFEQI